MPQLVTFQGRPVRRRYRVPDGLMLIFVHPQPGHEGQRLVVTQSEWDRDGQVRFYPRSQMPDVRALAARFAPS